MAEVASSAVDYLLIEAVPLAQRVVTDLGLASQIGAETAYRLREHGRYVGAGLVQLITREEPYLTDELDIMKFVCKELWTQLYRKQVDNLKTNRRDTYVLIDHNFALCQRMSTNLDASKTAELAAPWLWFPAGLLQGFLEGMGMQTDVTFEARQLPMVSFAVHVH